MNTWADIRKRKRKPGDRSGEEGYMSTYSKVKDLSARILEECEKTGLSIREVKFLLVQLEIDIGNSVGEETNPIPFKSHIIR